jgi:type II secretory pathway pseudopilin PulG
MMMFAGRRNGTPASYSPDPTMGTAGVGGMAFRGSPFANVGTGSPLDVSPNVTPIRGDAMPQIGGAFQPDAPATPNLAPPKQGFFSSRGGWLDVLGGVADAVSGQPIYGTAQREHRRQELELQQIQARAAIDQANRQQDREWQQENWRQQQQWKQDHPDDQFTQYLTAAGIDPRSPEGQRMYRQRAETMATPPTVAVDGFDAQGNPTKTFMPRAGIGSVQPAGPPVGTIRSGFRFVGGNPRDRSSWLPVGGASSTGGATFP